MTEQKYGEKEHGEWGLKISDLELPTYCRSISLCLFACFGEGKEINPNVIKYVLELSQAFDHVMFLTNTCRGDVTDSDKNAVLLDKPNVKILQVPNKCLDFGMWFRVLLPLIENDNFSTSFHSIALVNDSCHVLKPLNQLFYEGKTLGADCWGITESCEISYHLQSYFLVFEVTSIDVLRKFVIETDIRSLVGKTKEELIRVCEIGLSQFLLKHNMKLKAVYSMERLMKKVPRGDLRFIKCNPSWYLWETLLSIGCPLLKRKRQNKKIKLDLQKLIEFPLD